MQHMLQSHVWKQHGTVFIVNFVAKGCNILHTVYTWVCIYTHSLEVVDPLTCVFPGVSQPTTNLNGSTCYTTGLLLRFRCFWLCVSYSSSSSNCKTTTSQHFPMRLTTLQTEVDSEVEIWLKWSLGWCSPQSLIARKRDDSWSWVTGHREGSV